MSNVRSCFLILIVFFYVFNFTLTFLNVPSVALLIPVALFLILVDSGLRRFVGYAFVACRFVIVALLLAGFMGVTLSFIWGKFETVFLEIFVKFVVVLFLAFVLTYYAVDKKTDIDKGLDSLHRVFELIYWATFLQALFILASFVEPSFRDLLSATLANRGNIEVDSVLRFRGIHDSGGFSLSAILALGAVYGVYSIFSDANTATIWRLLSISIIALSITLVARTGIIIFLFGVLFLAVRWPRKALIGGSVFAACLALAVVLFQYLFPERYGFFSTYIFNYAFEIFINYSKGQGLTSASTDDLKSMLFVPDLVNIVAGSGSFDDQSGGVARSDSGYLKTLLASGIVGFVLVYASYGWMFLRIRSSIYRFADAEYFILVLLCLILMLEVKAPVFYQNDVSRLFILLFSCSLLHRFYSRFANVDSPLH
ncbi:hypothetical protein [Pseudomonas sp. EA_15y_Pfl1_P104]|uniref:hypothetical protein n=1 Tax=Pseudomonas sp. EA_15y_Pfl1_P104 TaxID=3088686 RepID=UPI0030D98BB2